MAKLQLRLDHEQVQDLLSALWVAIQDVDNDELVTKYAQLLAWLTWRRDKLWTIDTSGLNSDEAAQVLQQLRDKLSRRPPST